MKTSLYLILSALLLVIFSLVACKKNDPTPEDPLLQKEIIAQTTLPNNLKITLYADQSKLTVGYNRIYITVENANGRIELPQTVLQLNPMMDMHTMQHSSPVVQPVYNTELEAYEGAVVFTMPSMGMGSWKLQVEVQGETIDFDLEILSATTNTKPVGSYLGTNGKRYIVTLVDPAKPKIGMNDLKILINEQVDMHHFPSVNALNVLFEPEMPSMAHGSPNNENPVSVGGGFYLGKVNFTMSGDWRLHFTLKEGHEIVVEDAFLDLLF